MGNSSGTLSRVELALRGGRIAPLFRKYAIPGVITLVFMGLQSVIDAIVLGNFVGSNALASVSLILPCYSFITCISIVIGVGCETMISIRLGEQDRQGASNALKSAFVTLIFFAVIMSAIAFCFAPQIVRALGANDVLMSDSVNYLRALIPFFPIITSAFFCDNVIKAIGRPIYTMIVMSSTIIINIVLDLLFVAVFDMGTTGAGLATGIAFTVGALFNVPVVLKMKQLLSFREGHFSWGLVGRMIYNGSSEGISELSAGVTTMLFNLALMRYAGAQGVAAFTAINYVFFIGITVLLGVSNGIIPIVSYNFGANQWRRIKKVLRLSMLTNFFIGLALSLTLWLFSEQIISLFFRNGEDAIMEMASKGASIYAFAFLIVGINILASSYFTALGNAKISVIISVSRGLILTAIGITLLPEIFGLEGIWYAVPLAELLTLSITVLCIRKSLKGTKHLV